MPKNWKTEGTLFLFADNMRVYLKKSIEQMRKLKQLKHTVRNVFGKMCYHWIPFFFFLVYPLEIFDLWLQ